MTVDVYLPAGEYASFNAKNATGDINVPHEFSFVTANIKLNTGDLDFACNVANDVVIDVNTGDVKYSNSTAKSVTVKSDTGRVNLTDINVNEKTDLKSGTGKTNLKNINANDLKISSDTGRVTLTNTVVVNHIDIDVDTGDIEINDSDAYSLKLKTDTGDIDATLLTGKIFTAKKTTGSIKHLPENTPGAGLCEIITVTGDINIKIKS